MSTETVEYVKFGEPVKKKSEVPLTTTWNNARMIRIHSIKAAVREILNLADSLDVVKVNIVGPPSTGKTSLGELIQHLCHELATIPFTIKTFTRKDLLNFEYTLSKLEPTNHVLLFDDISFLSASAGKRQIDKIQKAFTEIRHLPGGQDVRIIAIFNFHYNMAVSKYLRQSDFFFYTAVGSSELENTQKIVGVKHTKKILEFRRVIQEALTLKKYTFKISKKPNAKNKGMFTYLYRNPFAPVLFYNNDTCRIVVFPLRQWLKRICPKCDNAKSSSVYEQMDIDRFAKVIEKKFGVGIIRHALKIHLFNMGVNTFPKRVKQCMQFITEYGMKNALNPEEIAQHYNLSDNRTRLDFKQSELDNIDQTSKSPIKPDN